MHVLFLSFLNRKYYFKRHLDGREGMVTFSVLRAAPDFNLTWRYPQKISSEQWLYIRVTLRSPTLTPYQAGWGFLEGSVFFSQSIHLYCARTVIYVSTPSMSHGAWHLEDVIDTLNTSATTIMSQMVGEIRVCASLWVGEVGKGESPFFFLFFTLRLKEFEYYAQAFTAPKWLF